MLPWGLPAGGITRTRGAVFLQAWDIVIAFAVLYVAFMVPYSLGFERLYLKPGDGDSTASEQCLFSQSTVFPFTVTRWIDLLVDFLFVSDILINFVSARWVLQGGTLEQWVLKDELSEIAKLYLRDTFVTDLLGTLPVQYLDCIPHVDAGTVKLMRLLRIIKLLRLRGLDNMASFFESVMPRSKLVIVCTKLLVSFVIVAHLSGCFFFWISYGFGDPNGHGLPESDPNHAFYREIFLQGWPVADGMIDEEGALVDHKSFPWVTSFYWAVTTMSTVYKVSVLDTCEREMGV